VKNGDRGNQQPHDLVIEGQEAKQAVSNKPKIFTPYRLEHAKQDIRSCSRSLSFDTGGFSCMFPCSSINLALKVAFDLTAALVSTYIISAMRHIAMVL